jgi:hypothetical protein
VVLIAAAGLGTWGGRTALPTAYSHPHTTILIAGAIPFTSKPVPFICDHSHSYAHRNSPYAASEQFVRLALASTEAHDFRSGRAEDPQQFL